MGKKILVPCLDVIMIAFLPINSSGRLQQQQVWGRGKGQKAGPPIY